MDIRHTHNNTNNTNNNNNYYYYYYFFVWPSRYGRTNHSLAYIQEVVLKPPTSPCAVASMAYTQNMAKLPLPPVNTTALPRPG